MNNYWVKVLFLYCGLIPFIFSVISLFLMGINESNISTVMLVSTVMVIAGIGVGIFAGINKNMSHEFGKRYVPIAFPLGFMLLLWTTFTLISGGFYGNFYWLLYAILQLPFVLISAVASFTGIGSLFFFAPLSFYGAFLISFFITERIQVSRTVIHKRQLGSALIILIVVFGIGQTVHSVRSQTVLPSHGFDYEGGYSSTELWPYYVDNPRNILPKLKEKATFTINDAAKMPILDGAEAAFPVYSAFAQATYDYITLTTSETEYVTFTNTIFSYERLLDRDIDIYFGAEPSDQQLKLTKNKGREIDMTPIGKEAFVFFVNKNNPIDSLDVSEIKDIYSGKITNWRDVGGPNKEIIAFQRPKNSGSQTLLEKIMGDTRLVSPLKEEVPAGMGGIIEQVADYRNYENSIGFSFRYFATGMHDIKNMKLIAINGVEPSTEHISTGTYPFSAELYAITLKDNPKSTIQPFLEWMQGPQGQEIVERVGYVKLAE